MSKQAPPKAKPKKSAPEKHGRAMPAHQMKSGVKKLPTYIPGFDFISRGGLPTGRTTLVAGSAGSAKTIFAVQFLAAGIIEEGHAGVFVTFEDLPDELRRNMRSFGWDIERWERENKWAFVDVSPDFEDPTPIIGTYDLGGLTSRIVHAVKRIGAKRVALDSLSALFMALPDAAALRGELYKIMTTLKQLNVTVIFTGERTEEYGRVTRSEVEEFVSDNVVILRNLLTDERRRRTMEVLKFRGASHERGEVPFTITDNGIVVIPLTAQELTQTSSTVRTTSGIERLDEMCGGGFFRDSVILVSGATGTGKTLMVTQFMNGGIKAGEKSLLFAFEESRDQLIRNAAAWGMDFLRMENEGLLKIVTAYPHAMPMEDHLVAMRKIIEEFEPQRVAVDSLSALERVFSLRSFREFVIGLTALLKRRSIASLFTSTTPTLQGGGSITEKHISTLTDSIILLRYVEVGGSMRRVITVLKMRGSQHDPDIHEYTIESDGMRIGEPFGRLTGILSGHQPDSGSGTEVPSANSTSDADELIEAREEE